MSAATPKALNPKQLRFIDEYLIDMNAAQAAIRAGYSKKAAKEQGYRLLTNVHIAAALAAKRKELAHSNGITRDRILKEIASYAFADVRKIFNPEGGMLDPRNIPDELAPAIASIELTSFTPPGEDAMTEHVKKVKFWDKPKGIEQLLKHLGLDEDKPDQGAAIGAASAATLASIEAFGKKLRERMGGGE